MAQDNKITSCALLFVYNGSRQWFKTMIQDNGSRQWFKTMVQDNGSRRDTLFAHLSTCFKTMVQDDGSR